MSRSPYPETRALIAVTAAAMGLAACGTVSLPSLPDLSDTKLPGVYRLTIQQGNVLDDEALSRLEIGMSKRKVTYLIGTPAIQDVFHDSRWDYVYTYQPGGEERTRRVVSLFFENERLARIEGAVPEAPARPARGHNQRVVTVPPNFRKRSFLQSLNPWSDTRKRRPPTVGATASEPSRSTGAPARKERPGAGNAGDEETSTPSPEQTAATDKQERSGSPPSASSAGKSEKGRVEGEGKGRKSLFERLTETLRVPAPPVPSTSNPAEDGV